MARKNEDKKKLMFNIEDELIHPFRVKVEDDQYCLYRENSVIAMGYYTSFGGIIKRIAHLKMVDILAGDRVSLRDFIETYQQITKTITERFDQIVSDGD